MACWNLAGTSPTSPLLPALAKNADGLAEGLPAASTGDINGISGALLECTQAHPVRAKQLLSGGSKLARHKGWDDPRKLLLPASSMPAVVH